MALEGQQVAGWVFDQLVADTGGGGVSTLCGGRIYRDRVPQSDPLPAVTVTLVSHVDTNTVGGRRVFAVTLVDVRVVGAGSSYQNTIAARVDAVLQNASGSRNGVAVVELRRDAVQAFVEDDAGRSYSHVIQTYRSEAYSA
jgi:hypothetical protein